MYIILLYAKLFPCETVSTRPVDGRRKFGGFFAGGRGIKSEAGSLYILNIYVHIISICISVYIYIYIYKYTEREIERERVTGRRCCRRRGNGTELIPIIDVNNNTK